MTWSVEFHPDFRPEFLGLSKEVRVEMAAHLKVLERDGPSLGRPHVDTLTAPTKSKIKNLKELRFSAGNGEWRVAFAFDPRKKAIVLVAGDKSGVSQERFYKQLIATAVDRYKDHINGPKSKAPASKGVAKGKKKEK